MNKRKPYNDCAGYVASRKLPWNGHVVLYDKNQIPNQFDTDYRWVLSCEKHATLTSVSSRKQAYVDLKIANHSGCEWCEKCQDLRFQTALSYAGANPNK